MDLWRPMVAALVAWALQASVAAQAPPEGAARPVDYAKDVRPILEAKCLSCHGPGTSKSGLRVDRRASLLKGGDSEEPSVVPGDGAGSVLIQAISGEDPGRKMPPKGEPLSKAQVDMLRAWVDQGAAMPDGPEEEAPAAAKSADHWSLHPVRPTAPPKIEDPWIANPIDTFVLERLRRSGLEPSSRTDPRTLIRRASLIVLGLPPTPEEIDGFLDAERADADGAYGRLVDELLARPQYGERWAQHWLDVIRWAETWGYETNAERPEAWPYRDWVVRALNDDLPFDRFAFEQIAGDTVGSDAATGFLVAGPANLPGQIGKDEPSIRQARQDELDETIKTVNSAFLGLTVACARCHDHKFDPIAQRDYYAMQGVFAGLHYGSRRLRGEEDARWASRAVGAKEELESLRERLGAKRAELHLRKPIRPEHHEERFSPVVADAVRMAIHATNAGRPSLFEFEVWSHADAPANVALASKGGRASASSFALENQTRHPDNLIDGLYETDDRFPWTAKEGGSGWVQVDLAAPTTIDRVAWQRGYEGFPVDFDIEVRRPDGAWIAVASARDRIIHEADRRPADKVALAGVEPAAVAELVGLVTAIRAADAEYHRLVAGPQAFSGVFGAPDQTYRLQRGDPMQRREVLAPDVPAVFGSLKLPEDADDAGRRVAFARWVASPENPLTARVIVNRVWQHHFGVGLVDTPSDFGRMGSAPSHPELLDWLAGEFVRGGWSLKKLHRLILMSSTFRQAAAPRPEALAKDADCRLLWRFPPRRMEAEAIRDSILRASGALNPQMYGPGFDFFNQKGGLTDYIPRESVDPPSLRRMIYATKVRMKPVDVFGAFDCPDAGQMAPRRPRSITPVQALGLLNSGFINRQAASFAKRVRDEAGPDPKAQVERAFLLAFGRHPAEGEAKALGGLAEKHGLEQVCRVLFNANEFVFVE